MFKPKKNCMFIAVIQMKECFFFNYFHSQLLSKCKPTSRLGLSLPEQTVAPFCFKACYENDCAFAYCFKRNMFLNNKTPKSRG